MRSGKCIVACTARASSRQEEGLLEKSGATSVDIPRPKSPTATTAGSVSRMRVSISVMVEGGGEVLASLVAEGLADRVYWFIAPMVISSVDRLADALRLRDSRVERTGTAFLISGTIQS